MGMNDHQPLSLALYSESVGAAGSVVGLRRDGARLFALTDLGAAAAARGGGEGVEEVGVIIPELVVFDRARYPGESRMMTDEVLDKCVARFAADREDGYALSAYLDNSRVAFIATLRRDGGRLLATLDARPGVKLPATLFAGVEIFLDQATLIQRVILWREDPWA